jgi:molybdopterin synthase sulfur carrier subunit
MIRVRLPRQLCILAKISGEVVFELGSDTSASQLLDALEERFPVLRGTIRAHGTLERRAYVRFFACQRDLSHASPDDVLPDPVLRGEEPFIVLGAMAGG